MVKKFFQSAILVLGLFLVGCSDTQISAPQTKSSETYSSKSSKPVDQTYQDLQKLNYSNEQQITVNNNEPGFTASELKVQTPWQKYSDLDRLNRAVDAEALLNKSLMPTTKREPLVWNPTGWHNKKMPNGTFLYNRSHLIGYQFTGQNNNPKNLITGTVSLNNPEMLNNEDTVAAYLKESSDHYVRYSVRPVYRGDELVPRGVWMRAQSLTDDRIHFNLYIFNIQDGMKIDYQTGYSQVVGEQNQQPEVQTNQKIWGNKRSKVYHVPGQRTYESGQKQGNPNNRVWFNSEQEAQNAGYRRAKN
ncbi:DNA/RNA non-specific endonuclease [Xylocopilactobacillus apis]|uniref:DNA-entry nuclease n=1 Tax=Xylocopilactobacillus apis TaxID=2932183 RepID=A0AAU9DUL0_9LACO|nr:DNA-entry nuclease [Xylocopilactobacillus apis]